MAILDRTIRRRDFLKGIAATATTAASASLAGCDLRGLLIGSGRQPHIVMSDVAILNNKGKWVTGECWGNCGGRCVNKAFVKDGVVLRQKTDDISDDSLEMPQQRSCPRGRSLRQHVFNANRLKYPMKRKHWQPGGGSNAHGELRGEDTWERISWDEALDLVAGELKRVYADHGPRSVVCMGTQWLPLNLMGGRVEWNGTESYGNWYLAPARMGTSVKNGMPDVELINDRLDLMNADTIVMYGVNSAWANGGSPTYYYRLAKEKGADFIFVGPDYNITANMLKAKWIRVRPGTDTVFLLAVAYEMLRLSGEGENIIDYDFLHKYCVGFDSESMPSDARLNENFKDYVLGAYDGQPKTPEWATEICGTPVEDITWYARKMTRQDNVTIHHSYGPSKYQGAVDLPQLFLTVACMGGHLGRPGNACGSCFSVEAANGGPKTVRLGEPSKSGSAPNNLSRPYICKAEVWKCINEGKYYDRGAYRRGAIDNDFQPQTLVHFTPKIIVNDFHNPLQATEDINAGIKAFKKMDMVVDIHYRYTLTSEYADILLPCLSPWEGNLDKSKGELVISNYGMMRLSKFQANRNFILVSQPVVPPMFESKDEAWIDTELMKRLGLDPKLLYPISSVQKYYDMLAGAQYLDEDGITWRTLATITQEDIDAWDVTGTPQQGVIGLHELLEKGFWQTPRKAGDNFGHIGYEDFIRDPVANPRKSASGKLEIYCQAKADSINGLGYAKEELKPYPTYHRTTYENTFVNWENKQKGKYPFIMYQPHYLRRAHTSYDENPWTREAWHNPVFINAADAKEKGIRTGDTVMIYNDIGKVLRKATVTNTLAPPGAIALPHGSRTYLDLKTGIDFGGNENMLISGDSSRGDFFPHVNAYYSTLVNIRKYEGARLPDDWEMKPVLWKESKV